MPSIKLKDLKDKFQEIPDKPGVYWYEINEPIEKPLFKEDNPAGHFHGKDPTVPVCVLDQKWVPGATILYIGETKNLRGRFIQRFEFAAGDEHRRAWGGRYLWQLDDSIQEKIAVRYEVVKNYENMNKEELRKILNEMEEEELEKFKNNFDHLPFANLAWGRSCRKN